MSTLFGLIPLDRRFAVVALCVCVCVCVCACVCACVRACACVLHTGSRIAKTGKSGIINIHLAHQIISEQSSFCHINDSKFISLCDWNATKRRVFYSVIDGEKVWSLNIKMTASVSYTHLTLPTNAEV